MLSAVIPTEHSYPAMPLVGQLVHQWFVRSGPLVLGAASLKLQRLQQIRTDSLLLDNHIYNFRFIYGDPMRIGFCMSPCSLDYILTDIIPVFGI